MPFVPLPTADVCNLTSEYSVKVAQAVSSRTWYNLNSSLWSIVPERITFHADGRGEISSPFAIYPPEGQTSKVMSFRFTWKLAHWHDHRHDNLYLSFSRGSSEDMHLFDTIPKLIKSEEAWTRRAWTPRMAGRVRAYLHFEPDGRRIALEPEPDSPISFIPGSPDGMLLPPELLEAIFLMASKEEIAAQELTMTCRRSREIVMKRRRRETFTVLVERFLTNGLALWIECGHFDPVPNSSKPPTSFYGMEARMLKYPYTCGCPEDRPADWRIGWNVEEGTYHSCQLTLPKRENPTLWRRLRGDKEYDAHPEVKKVRTVGPPFPRLS